MTHDANRAVAADPQLRRRIDAIVDAVSRIARSYAHFPNEDCTDAEEELHAALAAALAPSPEPADPQLRERLLQSAERIEYQMRHSGLAYADAGEARMMREAAAALAAPSPEPAPITMEEAIRRAQMIATGDYEPAATAVRCPKCGEGWIDRAAPCCPSCYRPVAELFGATAPEAVTYELRDGTLVISGPFLDSRKSPWKGYTIGPKGVARLRELLSEPEAVRGPEPNREWLLRHLSNWAYAIENNKKALAAHEQADMMIADYRANYAVAQPAPIPEAVRRQGRSPLRVVKGLVVAKCSHCGTEFPISDSHECFEAVRGPEAHRWNVRETNDGVAVCRGQHEKGDKCDWEYYIQPPVAQPAPAPLSVPTPFPHWCRLDHEQIGFRGDSEICPLCHVMAENDMLRAELAQAYDALADALAEAAPSAGGGDG